MSDGSQHVLAYVAESTYGTTPTTPAMIEQRHTSCDLRLEKDQFVSRELSSLRQVKDVRHGTKRVTGGFGFELSDNCVDDFLEALLGGTWGSNILKVGNTRRAFTFERQYTDVASTFQRFTGCEINTLNLQVRPNDIVRGTFGVVGQAMAKATSALDASLTAAPTGAVMDSLTGTISEGGSAIATVTAIDLSVSNDIVPRYVVGSALTLRPGIGQIQVTGQLTAYFEDATLLDKFITETNTTLDVQFSDGTNTLAVALARMNYTSGETPAPDAGPITQVLQFRAVYDASDATCIKFTRSA